MKVNILRKYRDYREGETYEVGDIEGKALIAHGYAETEKVAKEMVAGEIRPTKPEAKETKEMVSDNSLTCAKCGFVAKSKRGLTLHSKVHKKDLVAKVNISSYKTK